MVLLLGKEQALDSLQLDSLSLHSLPSWDEADEDAFEVANPPGKEQPQLTSWIDIKKRIGRPRNRFVKTVYSKCARAMKNNKKIKKEGEEKKRTRMCYIYFWVLIQSTFL